jgi:hypothetical protein
MLVVRGSRMLYIFVVNNSLVLNNLSNHHGSCLLLWSLYRNQRVVLCWHSVRRDLRD